MFDPTRVYSRVWLKPRLCADGVADETGEPIASHTQLRMAIIRLNFISLVVTFHRPPSFISLVVQTANNRSLHLQNARYVVSFKHFVSTGSLLLIQNLKHHQSCSDEKAFPFGQVISPCITSRPEPRPDLEILTRAEGPR